jgi:two-component system sensor histidine kinase QseC
MRTSSLSTTLLRNTAAVLVLICGMGLGLYEAVAYWGPVLLFSSDLRSNSDGVLDALRFDAEGKPLRMEFAPKKQVMYNALANDFIYRVLDAQGRVLLSSDGGALPFAPDGLRFDPTRVDFRVAPAGVALRVMTRTLQTARGPLYIQSARSDRFQRVLQLDDERKSRSIALGSAAIAVLAFPLAVWLTFRRALRPLREASTAAARIAPGNLHARLEVHDIPAEIVPLISAFNAALERVERGYQVQQEFLATAAHELKTPLTLMRAELELDGASNPALLLKDVERMSRQVQQLLNLAECSEPNNYVFEKLDANLEVEDATAHLRRLASQRGMQIEVVRAAVPSPLHADRSALFVLLKNLLENAILHSGAGMNVRVIVGAGRIVVQDQGGGIPEADMPMLFQRFWRGAHRRDEGAGLGLSICREIVQAHGWRLNARNAHGGAEFTVDTATPFN